MVLYCKDWYIWREREEASNTLPSFSGLLDVQEIINQFLTVSFSFLSVAGKPIFRNVYCWYLEVDVRPFVQVKAGGGVYKSLVQSYLIL